MNINVRVAPRWTMVTELSPSANISSATSCPDITHVVSWYILVTHEEQAVDARIYHHEGSLTRVCSAHHHSLLASESF